MELGNFLNWTVLFATYMMSIGEQWKVSSKSWRSWTQRCHGCDRGSSGRSQDGALYINFLGYTRGRAHSSTVPTAVDMAFVPYWDIHSKGKNATKMNIVIMNRCCDLRAPRELKISRKNDEWTEKQRYLEDVGVPPIDFDQKKTLLLSILTTTVMDYYLYLFKQIRP